MYGGGHQANQACMICVVIWYKAEMIMMGDVHGLDASVSVATK